MLQSFLVRAGYDVGRLHVATLMRRMGIEAIYRRPNTSKPAPGHTILPYLLRKLPVTRPNQVWAMDITYIPMARGFVYLAAVVDWFSRKVLAWKLSITLETAFCLEAVEEALSRHGKPEIFNTDQGSQFTSSAFTGLLMKNEIRISMDGKGAWRDNVFVERLWRTIKYEGVYLRAYANVPEARSSIGRYIDGFYNATRPHSSLDRQTPDEAYFNGLQPIQAEIHSTIPGVCSNKPSHLSFTAFVQRPQNDISNPGERPAPELAVGRTPFAVLFMQIAPGHAVARNPDHAIQYQATIGGWPARCVHLHVQEMAKRTPIPRHPLICEPKRCSPKAALNQNSNDL
jgi:putative transposase